MPRIIEGVRRQRWHLLELLLLLAIVTLGLVLRWQLFFGVVRPDSLDYAHDAVGLLRGAAIFTEQANPIHVTRLTVSLPLALAYALFGYAERAAVAWPLVASLAGIVVVWLGGRALLGPRVGLLAALLLAINSLDVAYATQLLPDAIVSTFLTIGACCFLAGLRGRAAVGNESGSGDRAGETGGDKPRPYGPGTGGRAAPGGDEPRRYLCGWEQRRWWLAAGVALGLAYYARLNAPVLLGTFALWLIALRGPWRSLGWVAVGLAPVLGAAAVVFTLWGGDPLYDLRRSFAPLFVPENREVFRASLSAEHLTIYVRALLAPPLRLWTALAVLGVFAAWPARRGPVGLLLIWFGWLFLYFEVLSQWPVVSMPEKGDRFLLPLLPPLALLGGLALEAALRRIARQSSEPASQKGSAEGVRRGEACLAPTTTTATRVGGSQAGLQGRLRPALQRGGAALALGLLLGFAVLPGLARLPTEAAALRAWRAGEPQAVAAALAGLSPRPVYLTTNWLPWLNVFLGFPGLAPGDSRPALQRLPFGDQGWPAPVRDAYVVHDRGVIMNRSLSWSEVATPTARGVIYLAPPDAPPPCPEGTTSPPYSPSPRADRGTGGEGTAPLSLPGRGAGGEGIPASTPHPNPLPAGEREQAPPCARPESFAMDLEAELFRGLAPAGSDDPVGAKGWTSYGQSFYSAGGAAITRRAGQPIWQNIWTLLPGEYQITLRVYDQGSGGRNVLAVRLNHTLALARWRSTTPGLREVRVALADPDGGNLLALTPLFVGQGTLIVDRVTIARGRVPEEPPQRGPVAMEAEEADGLALAPGGDYSRAEGWTSYAMPFYSGGRAAITRQVGGTFAVPIPLLSAGDYQVTVAVYDYGNGGENVLEITLNGVVGEVRWASATAGIHGVAAILRGVSRGADLRLRALRNAQGYVIVDKVVVEQVGQ